jgi:hypothetical protein
MRQKMILSNLPYDVTSIIYKNLLLTDINSLSVTSRELFKYIQNDQGAQEMKRQRFDSLFGIVAKCEGNTLVNTLANRILNLCYLNLTSEQHASLTFDTQGIPSISLSPPINEPSKSSGMQNSNEVNKKGIPSLVEADYKKEAEQYAAMIPHLDAIFNNYKQVIGELLDKTWEQTHSIHEYGNRNIRMKYMLKEIENLRLALASTFPELSKIDCYRNKIRGETNYEGLRWLGDLRKNPPIEHFLDRVFELKRMVSLNDTFWSGRICQMELGVATIQVNGQTMPIKIVAKRQYDNNEIRVQFLDENQENIGGMWIERRWYKDLKQLHTNSVNDVITRKELFSKSNILPHTLFTSYIGMIHVQDKETGDKPLIRLLVQVAVEIFNREPARRLLINNGLKSNDVVALLGLGSTNKWFNVNRKELLEFRANSQSLLPDQDTEGSDVWMDKLEFSEEHKTQYFKILDAKKGLEPAFIEFDPKETVTWEEQIRRKPVLNGFSGPLF